MVNNMSIDKKILEEIRRYQGINKYITEQEVPPADPTLDLGGVPPAPEDPAVAPAPGAPEAPVTPDAAATPEVIDTTTDPDVEKLDSEGEPEGETEESDTEELDITDLVDSQNKISDKQDEYFENLFKHLENLENKLGEMDELMNKVNSLEAKLEKYRPKTPQEKLELRSLDSGPYNQKLSDFFIDKEGDMEKSGKNEYILTTDEVENFTPSEIRTSFNPEQQKNFGI
jgi:hypothetical protein